MEFSQDHWSPPSESAPTPQAPQKVTEQATSFARMRDVLQRHREWMEEDGMRPDGVPIHDCDFGLNPEAGTCEFHELYAETVFALEQSVQGSEDSAPPTRTDNGRNPKLENTATEQA